MQIGIALALAAVVGAVVVMAVIEARQTAPAVAAASAGAEPRGSLVIDFAGNEVRDRVGDEFFAQSASEGGVLLLVRYRVTNDGDFPVGAYEVPTIQIYDPAGVAYASDVGKTSAYATEPMAQIDTKAMSDINPGITTRGAEVFEISRSAFASGGWTLGYEGLPPGDRLPIALDD